MSRDPLMPRWRGQMGFFEIWFVVVFEPQAARAWWFRYTTFASRAGVQRGTVWAAAFQSGRRACWGKRFVGVEEVRAAVIELGRGVCSGRVDTVDGPIVWDLRLHGGERVTRGPAWLERLPTPTRVAHVRAEASVTGSVRVGNVSLGAVAGMGALKHLWGTRRVEELFWIYSPCLDDGGVLEATSVRPRRASGPRVSPAWLTTGGHGYALWGLRSLLRSAVEPAGAGRLRVRAASPTARIDAIATCDPRTLAGYVYRDPSGFDLHVAQSDVATCEATVRTRPHRFADWSVPRRLTAPIAAVEFHHPEPLAGVRYVAWDGTTVAEGA